MEESLNMIKQDIEQITKDFNEMLAVEKDLAMFIKQKSQSQNGGTESLFRD